MTSLRPPYDAAVMPGTAPERLACEADLLSADRALPLQHRAIWEELRDGSGSWFLRLRDGSGRCVFGCVVDVSRSRALPGHRILRVPRFGSGFSKELLAPAVRELAAAARSRGTTLRLRLEVFSRDPEVHEIVGSAGEDAGFTKARSPRSYRETAEIDLTPDLDDVFMSLHSTGRRHIRAVDKNPVAVRTVDDPSYGPRLDELLGETMNRTGGRYEPRDWAAMIDFCKRHPRDARLVGLFHEERQGPEALLAYAVGYNHGDHVQYSTAASTREDSLNMPLAYGIAWDLIRWAREVGADWFDFGGITRGSHDDPDDPRGGISDFKRYFTREIIEVGSEWVLEPHPLRARTARTVSGLADALRRTLG